MKDRHGRDHLAEAADASTVIIVVLQRHERALEDR